MYNGKLLPDLKIDTAVHYHNECIRHLILLSNDPDQVHDENLLAAAIILRFYEEVDGKQHSTQTLHTFLLIIPFSSSPRRPRQRLRTLPPRNQHFHQRSSPRRPISPPLLTHNILLRKRPERQPRHHGPSHKPQLHHN